MKVYDIIINEENGEKWELHSTCSYKDAVEIASEYFANIGLIVQIFSSSGLEAQFGF